MLRFLKREPSAVLLFVQLAGVLLYPFMEGSGGGQALFSLFGILVLALVVLAVRSSPALTWVSLLLGVPALILLVIQAITGDDDLLPYSSALEAILYFYAAGALIAYMLADHEITRDELFAVGATFTLVAWAFAYVYVVCQAIYPGSFTAAVDPEADRTWIELLFLSFTTLTSTGLSDVVPVKPFARGLVMIEQLAGLAYVAVLVSRLVALTIRGAREGSQPGRAPSGCVPATASAPTYPSSSSRSISANPSGRVVSNPSGAQPSPPPIALASASLRHHTRSSSTWRSGPSAARSASVSVRSTARDERAVRSMSTPTSTSLTAISARSPEWARLKRTGDPGSSGLPWGPSANATSTVTYPAAHRDRPQRHPRGDPRLRTGQPAARSRSSCERRRIAPHQLDLVDVDLSQSAGSPATRNQTRDSPVSTPHASESRSTKRRPQPPRAGGVVRLAILAPVPSSWTSARMPSAPECTMSWI